MELFIVGQITNGNDPVPKTWDFQGVFSTKILAEAACINEWYFVGPAVLDKSLPVDTIDWPGAYYPQAR